MAFANSGDPNIAAKSEDFGEFPKGNYTVNGIEDFFTVDDQGFPVFKPSKTGKLISNCHLRVDENVARFPAWSGTAEDYYKLATAMGANLEGLKVESTTHFLMEIDKRVNSHPREMGMTVGSNGWVSFVPALQPTTGMYRLAFKDAYSLDKTTPISFQKKDNPFDAQHPLSIVRFQFEIVSDVEGDTEFAGRTFMVDVNDPFDGVSEGLPAWKRALNGGMLSAQRRLLTFMGIYWPDAEDYKWVADPEQSEYGIDETRNPIVVIVDKAKQSNRLAMARLERTPKGYLKTDLAEFAPVRGSAVSGVQPAQPAVTTDEQPPWKTETTGISAAHKKLMALINDEAYPSIHTHVFDPASENPYALTEKGSEWCKKNVLPVWDELKLGTKHNFSILTDEQADILTKTLRAQYDTSTF